MTMSNPVQVTANSAGTTVLLAAAPGRVFLSIKVPQASPELIRFTWDGNVASATRGMSLEPGLGYECKGPYTPETVVKVWSALGTGIVDVSEGVTTSNTKEP